MREGNDVVEMKGGGGGTDIPKGTVVGYRIIISQKGKSCQIVYLSSVIYLQKSSLQI